MPISYSKRTGLEKVELTITHAGGGQETCTFDKVDYGNGRWKFELRHPGGEVVSHGDYMGDRGVLDAVCTVLESRHQDAKRSVQGNDRGRMLPDRSVPYIESVNVRKVCS